ncbi:MAG TPA: PD-(D/E)XK nuclease family protein [Gaiellaceae bacterium]|nr:PD-(D/E)XK nuclease family protein [Gaiellaceae bacterium]
MGLSLLAGPANAGKVALLLERYLARLDDEPVLIVPNASDVDRVERDLLARCGCLFSGYIGTFDDVFRRLVRDDPEQRPVATDAQRALVVRRVLAAAPLNGLARSARTAGFGDALVQTLGELEQGMLDPEVLDGDLGRLYAAYRDELDRLRLWDRDLLRRRAAERLGADLDAWHGEPVFAYGFEDLTGAEWWLLAAFAGRTDVEVSLPYEPGRVAFASLSRTADDLTSLALGRIEELPARSSEYAHEALAHLERALFEESPPPAPDLDAAVRFLEGAGSRGTLELVGDELAQLIRSGIAPDAIALVAPSLDAWRGPLDTVLGALDIPYAVESRVRLGDTPLGQALLQFLRYAWADAGRRELFAYLRSPYSGLARSAVDYVEGRLRGRAIHTPGRVEEEAEKLREAPISGLAELRGADRPVDAVRALLRTMLRAAYGTEAPPAGETSRLDLRAYGHALALLDELDGIERLGETIERDDVLAALERCEVRLSSSGEAGRVAVLELLRARTRRFEVVFLLGLEEGSLPRRARTSPFLDDTMRASLGGRLERPDGVSRDRYLFYTACTRATRRLYLVREAATDEGAPREPSPFWEEVAAVFDPADVEHATVRRPLSALTWRLDGAPSERERLRALALLAAAEPNDARALAEANGWERRLARARLASRRKTRLESPAALAWLGSRTTFAVTELERFADCSSAWLFERVISPRTIDAAVDPMLRGLVAHSALHKFYAGLPRELGHDQVTEENLEQAVGFLRRCLDDALRGGVRLELTDLQAAELEESLWRDLEGFVRDEAASPLRLVPRRFEVGFGTDRSAPELQRGLHLGEGLHLSGKIDRIDVDPFSARGIVQDYKSGRSAHSAKQIDEELKLQIPLYMLVLRDLVGIEPLGGVYRALAGARVTRGLLAREAEEDLPGFQRNDYLDGEDFWGLVETARERALGYALRIRGGDVRHDPKGGDCPAWCDLWTMCRVERA